MKDTKIIVFDVGNTLIWTKNGLSMSDNVLACLKSLKTKGHIIGLSTLRTEENIKDITDQFMFDFMILANGGIVKDGDKYLYEKCFCQSDIKCIEEVIFENNLKYKTYAKDGEIFAYELLNANITTDSFEKFETYLWTKTNNIDVTPKGINKVSGLKIYLDSHNYTKDDLIAFGDGFNDIEMLEFANVGVAMGGAPSELIQVSSIQTDSAEFDGIVKGCKELGLL